MLAGVAGVVLGMAIAWSAAMARALTPFLVFVNTLPKVAIAPLFLMWLGYGIVPNILIGALIGFFPVVINTAVGLTQIDDDLVDLGRVFNAPKWKVFLKIRVPNAYPYILSALKVTATAAVVGAIVGEFVASQRGLGYVIITTQSSMNTPVAFAALVWISMLGLLLFGFVALLSRLLVPWAPTSSGGLATAVVRERTSTAPIASPTDVDAVNRKECVATCKESRMMFCSSLVPPCSAPLLLALRPARRRRRRRRSSRSR